MAEFQLEAPFRPAGDQPRAIAGLIDGLRAVPFTLPDLDGVPHELTEWKGRKRLLVAFSTW